MEKLHTTAVCSEFVFMIRIDVFTVWLEMETNWSLLTRKENLFKDVTAK